MEKVRGSSVLGVGVASLFVCTGVHAAITITPGTVNADGVFITPLDNPVFTGSSPLAPLERAVRVADNSGDAWALIRHELHMLTTCQTDDPFCVSAGSRSDEGVLNVWPNIAGDFAASAGTPEFPFEAHGLRLGLKSATVRLEKYNRDGSLATVGSLTAALDPSTLVVPVNVVVVRPTEAVSADIRDEMARFLDVPYYKAYFDDQWVPNLTRVTQPGGLLNVFEGNWTTRTTSFTATDGSLLSRPTRRLLEDYIGCRSQVASGSFA